MQDYLTEVMYRFCTKDGWFQRYLSNKDKFLWICKHSDDESISRRTFHAALLFMDKFGKAPTLDSIRDWALHNPDDISAFKKSFGAIESDLLSLKDYETLDLDDDVLFASLFDAAEKSLRLETSKEFVRNNHPIEWLHGQFRELEALKKPPEPDIFKEDTSELEWLGVTTDDDDDTYTLRVQRLSQIKMKKMAWLWPDKVPSGKVTIISGKAGKGKTLCLIDWLSRVTTGSDWPDGSKNTYGPRRVMFCSAEDDAADTMKPRFVAAGADLDKVLIPKVFGRLKDSNSEFNAILNVKRDLPIVAKVVAENPDIAVLVLDPLTSYLGGANLNKDEEIRPLMDKLIAVGQRTGLTILVLVHSSKRSDVDAMEKVMGANSITGGARTVWTFAQDTDDESLYRMVNAKGNVLRKKGGFEYHIADAEVEIDGEKSIYPKIQWGKETDMNANDMLTAERQKARGSNEDAKLNIAIAVLRTSVPGYARDVFEKAKQEGFEGDAGERLVYRAKEKLGVKTDTSRGKGKAYWYFPGEKGDPALTPVVIETFVPEEAIV